MRRAHREMMDPEIFDRGAVRRHRDRAARSVGRVAEVLRDAAERLLDRLDDTTRQFRQALDIGGRGVVAPLLRARGIETVSCDLSYAMAALNGGASVVADEEFLPFGEGSFDLVVASLSLHWINDLPGALIQLRRALRPEGLLLASLPALGTLAELRQTLTETEAALTGGVSPRVSPFAELRDSGETKALRERDRHIPPLGLFPAALAAVPLQDGRTAATLRLAVMTGWA